MEGIGLHYSMRVAMRMRYIITVVAIATALVSGVVAARVGGR